MIKLNENMIYTKPGKKKQIKSNQIKTFLEKLNESKTLVSAKVTYLIELIMSTSATEYLVLLTLM